MAEKSETLNQIMEQRIAIVNEIIALNAEQLRNTQMISGNQVELMRCEENSGEQAQSELAEARLRDDQLRAKMRACEDRLKDLEGEIVALDDKLAGLGEQ